MIGIAYIFLSVLSLLFWKVDGGCATTCSVLSSWGLLGRSWWLWGGLYYAVAGVLCFLLPPKNRLIGIILTAGAIFHAGLIGYGYATTGLVCPSCWKFAATGALLVALYWIMPGKTPCRAPYILSSPALVMVLIAMTLLVTNPATEIVAVSQANPVSTESQSNSVKTGEPKSADATASYNLRVLGPNGKETYLDLRKKPALLFAAWCPHCPDALKDASELSPEKRPYLVVTYLRDGDREKTKEKLAENGLAGKPYYLVESPPEIVQGVPTLIWWDGGLKIAEGVGALK